MKASLVRVCVGLSLVILSVVFLPGRLWAQGSYNGVQTTLLTGVGTNTLGGVNVDAMGNVFVADPGNNRVQMLPYQGGAPIMLGSGLKSPAGVAVDNAGNVYIADTGNSRVVELPWAGSGYGEQIALPTVGLNTPGDVEVDAAGNVFITDCGNDRVVEMPAGGGAQVTVPVTGLSFPAGVGLDAAGDVFIADQKNNRIIEVPWTGKGWRTQTTVPASGLNNPTGVSVDDLGNVFIADYGNNRVVGVPWTGSAYGAQAMVGSGFSHPIGATADQNRNVFIVDTGSNRLIKLMMNAMNFGWVSVGSSSGTLSMSFTVNAGTTLYGSGIVAEGGATTEFVDAGGSTCAAKTYTAATNCVFNMKFKPANPGLRRGGLVLYDKSGNGMGSWRFYGVGAGPEAAFSAAKIAAGASTPNLGAANHVKVDGAGNLFVSISYNSKEQDNSGMVIEYPKTASGYGNPVTVASGVSKVRDLFLDGSGNLFMLSGENAKSDSNSGAVLACVKSSKGWGAVQTVVTGLNYPEGLVLDENMDMFLTTGDGTILEIPRGDSSFGAPVILASGLSLPKGLTLDAEGSIFFTVYSDSDLDPNTGSLMELPRQEFGWGSPITLASGLSNPQGLALDADGSVLVASESDAQDNLDSGAILKIPYSGKGYGSPMTLASGLSFPDGIGLDGTGNIFFADWMGAQLYELPRATPPTLSFARTARGSTSTDSPQTVTVENIGNQPLVFSALSYAADFPEEGSPVSDCTSATTLAAGDDCTLSIEFNPETAVPASGTAALSESLQVTTNSLNAATAQKVSLSGTEITGAKFTPAVTLVASSTTPPPGVPVTLTATVTGTGGTPTGAVTFSLGGTKIGQAVTLVKGVATLSTTLASSGVVVAAYAGDQNFTAATSNTLTVTLTKPTPAVTLTSSANPATITTTVTFTAAVSTVISGTAPTGTVQFFSNGTQLGTGTLSAGKATYAASKLAAGSYAITATYSGDTKYQSASAAALTETVALAAPTMTLTSSANTATILSTVTFTVAVSTVITGTAPTGTVQFLNGSTVLGTGTLAAGKASYATTSLPAGANTINAVYSGDSKYATATKSLVETINLAAPSVTLTSSANPATVASSVTLTASVSTAITGVPPTGTVQFLSGTSVLGTGTLSGGKATFATSSLAGGANSISAVYSGDTKYATAKSSALTETINKATPTVTMTSSANPAAGGTEVTFTVTVSTKIQGLAPTGTVQFKVGSTVAGTGTLSGGTATYTTSSLRVGANTITAAYGGDSNFAAATSNSLTETVSKATPLATLNVSPNPGSSTGSVTFQVRIGTVIPNVVPSGSVQFYNGTALAGTVTLSAGQGSFTAKNLTAGSHAIKANYLGDSNYLAVSSNTVTEIIN